MDIEKILQRGEYFWDVDISALDVGASKRLIIERVFSLGEIAEMKTIIACYGEKEVVDVLCSLNYLDPKTLNFVSKFFNTPKHNFRCYTRKQLTPQRWSS